MSCCTRFIEHWLNVSGRGAKCCDELDMYICSFVCPPVCASVRELVSGYTSNLYHIIMHVAYGHGSVLFWQRCDTSYISSFMDDVMLAHNGQE